MNTHHMQQGLKGSIAGVVAAATLLAGGILTVPHAMALEADGQYYSSKQPYVAPSEATTASYSQAPEGYETVYTESMARHGSRGLSSYKYDALLMKMAEAAEADNGFKSDAIKSEFMKNLKAITAAKVVPEKLRTLDRGRPWRDSQFASTRLSPSRDMSR